VALALGRLAAEQSGNTVPDLFASVDVAAAAQESGVALEDLERLASVFITASGRVAIPGGTALAHTNGLENAQVILALNGLIGAGGKAGAVLFAPSDPLTVEPPQGGRTLADLGGLVERMKQGQIKALFIHGVNPVFELPKALGFAEALKNVPLVISLASFPDETALASTYVFPDHTPLESWGYQRVMAGADRLTLSGAQPVVTPLYETKAAADVLLAAVRAIGGDLAAKVPYTDEVDFLQQKVAALIGQGGAYDTGDPAAFWTLWLQHGGWWKAEAGLDAPQIGQAYPAVLPAAPEFAGAEGDEFHLYPYPSTLLGDGSGANRPWLQETPDPMTTAMWGAWVEINPVTAHELGIADDDVVKLTSPVGEIEAIAYLYPAIRPDTVAIPFGQGHTALGRYAQGRGVNPFDLLGVNLNAAGDLAFAATKVKLTPTGKKQQLARYESRVGVYGDH
jgi:anaerobic selenocysteine-containing dehydrogenase